MLYNHIIISAGTRRPIQGEVRKTTEDLAKTGVATTIDWNMSPTESFHFSLNQQGETSLKVRVQKGVDDYTTRNPKLTESLSFLEAADRDTAKLPLDQTPALAKLIDVVGLQWQEEWTMHDPQRELAERLFEIQDSRRKIH